LFKPVTNEPLYQLEEKQLGAKIGTICTAIPTCADDMAVITPTSKYQAQTVIDVVQDGVNKDRISINNSKTQTIHYINSGNKNDTPDLQLNNTRLEIQNTAIHLGVLQGSDKDINIQRIEKSITTATRTIYALFGAGCHGRNGVNPVVTRKLWTTYIQPRFLYGTELWMLSDNQYDRLERFQRNKLRMLQDLPTRTANIAVLGMMGLPPVQGQVEKRILSMFRNISSKPDNIEYSIAQRQLAVKSASSKSWFRYVDDILIKLQLPDAHSILANPPSKAAWKKMVDKAISHYYETYYKNDAEERGLSSIQYLSAKTLDFQQAATVWKQSTSSLQDTRKAIVKARLMTGTLSLQAQEAKFKRNQHPESPACKMCTEEPEDRQHFLLRCKELQPIRDSYMSRVKDIMRELECEWVLDSPQLLTQLLLDATHTDLPSTIYNNPLHCTHIENISRDMIYHMYTNRLNTLNQYEDGNTHIIGRHIPPHQSTD
jgi:hypothetical protein